MSKQDREFAPGLLHPFYFIRNGLRNAISPLAPALHGKLLDFGCGSKPYKELFKVEDYVGVDYYNEGHPHDDEQIDVYYDGKKLPFDNDVFDSVLCSEVFEHVFNLDEVLKELNRVMKNQSPILVTVPFAWNEHEVPYDFARYTKFALQSMLEKNGFEILTISKSGNLIIAIFQLWNLFFYRKMYLKVKKIFILRWLYKVIVFLVNISCLFINWLFPKDDSFYLNTIVLAKKVKENV
jgi:SAM-dependent methyltransferase